jgi:Ala-tRNA(Pro) deacylase
MKPEVEKFLSENEIEFKLYYHPAVFTCEEAKKYFKDIPSLSCKNLFFKDKKTGRYYLVTLPVEKRMDIKQFATMVFSKHLSFANAEELFEVLKLTPGSVSPCGLINDHEQKTRFYIDKAVWDADAVNFHPNVNTESIELSKEMFRKFLDRLGHRYQVTSL